MFSKICDVNLVVLDEDKSLDLSMVEDNRKMNVVATREEYFERMRTREKFAMKSGEVKDSGFYICK